MASRAPASSCGYKISQFTSKLALHWLSYAPDKLWETIWAIHTSLLWLWSYRRIYFNNCEKKMTDAMLSVTNFITQTMHVWENTQAIRQYRIRDVGINFQSRTVLQCNLPPARIKEGSLYQSSVQQRSQRIRTNCVFCIEPHFNDRCTKYAQVQTR